MFGQCFTGGPPLLCAQSSRRLATNGQDQPPSHSDLYPTTDKSQHPIIHTNDGVTVFCLSGSATFQNSTFSALVAGTATTSADALHNVPASTPAYGAHILERSDL